MARNELIFRVFVSSTFSDMVAERQALQQGVFPRLREYCRQHGARFQAIDLRWGVSQEAAIDQQTMNICTQELRRCQELSPRPNFIVLLGDRYGWRPLPPQIDAAEFESLLAVLNEAEQDRLKRWYRRDDNALPAEYTLQPRSGEFADPSRWAEEETALRDMLARAVEQVLDPDSPECDKYFDSATHQEIRCGALNTDEPETHVFCYLRSIHGLPEDTSASFYRDMTDGTVNEYAGSRLISLKEELRGLLPAEHVHEYTAVWDVNEVRWDRQQLCQKVEADLRAVIEQEVANFEQAPALARENQAHQEFARKRSEHIRGREDVLSLIARYLSSNSLKPLVLHGVSGSGKSAIMAQACLGARRHDPQMQTIARFIGVTPGSCDLRSLLTDLCLQAGIEEPPCDMTELINAFKWRFSEEGNEPKGLNPQDGTDAAAGRGATDDVQHQPVVLFLDALDQLNATEGAHTLHWLPRKLRPGVKLVLSVLEKRAEPGSDALWDQDDPWNIARSAWTDSLVEVGQWADAAAEQVLDIWLNDARRALQPDQRRRVLTGFGACPYPLYLKLAFEEARRWPSWQALSQTDGLSGSIEGVLADLLGRLEQADHHGRQLTERALAYIATGKNGLTEDELLDLLSADPDVIQDFRCRNPDSPPVNRLPIVVWSRLHADIEPYMARRRADGTVLMGFYHRQVAQAVCRRYLQNAQDRLRSHDHLARYFHALEYFAESIDQQRRRAGRLPYSARPVNIRKVVELPYHRLEAAKLGGSDDATSSYWDAVADLLTDWQFLEAKNEAPSS